MKIKIKELFYMLLIIFLATNLFAEPEVNINKEYYYVKGFSKYEIRKDINKIRFEMTGANYDAITKWHINWKYRWKKNNGLCKIYKVNTEVNVTIIAPKLLGKNKIDKKLLHKWEDYKKNLMNHEYGHKNFAIQTAREIENELMQISSPNCYTLDKKANKKAKNLMSELKIKNIEYDRRTNHGMNDRARF